MSPTICGITKRRHLVELADGHTAEFDLFDGALSGRRIVEVEFDDDAGAAAFRSTRLVPDAKSPMMVGTRTQRWRATAGPTTTDDTIEGRHQVAGRWTGLGAISRHTGRSGLLRINKIAET